ncbi:galactan 5-O-arabinofuranosyltransferase [Aldersonia kunmingensis]|uniref:galactan 5-O-arabinofuranosyltransferase n=1 Tax=Aldersonia kunmingensis TaxID=408066 RepID=UPI0008326560|nr:galactan 5-O-arabinofuranosyltransferase [Aldersonia kunmingensis]
MSSAPTSPTPPAAEPASFASRRAVGAVGEALAAAVVSAIVAAIGLIAFSIVDWPAFNSSNVTKALTTVGQVAALAVLGISIALIRSGRRRPLAKVLSWAGLSGFVTVTLGMPLSATKLYLLGISVDQQFRTEYLTRLTDSAALHDMTYADLPPYYPAGWFWIGGRVANVFGMDGWEVFKPYAIGSLAVVAVVALVLWTELIRADWAVVTATAVTSVLLAFGSPEPYGAVIALLLGPVLILAWGALYRPEAGAHVGWAATVGTGLFVGFAATFYTLYAGFAAFAVATMAVVAAAAGVRRNGWWRGVVPPALRLAIIGAIALLVALIVWLPYLLELRTTRPAGSGTATHYLPDAGAHFPLPMLDPSLLGALCMLGTLWLVFRSATSRRAQALGIGVVALYLWVLASMAFTALGNTLLSFRLEPILLALLAAAGVFGFLEASRALYQFFGEPPRFRAAVAIVGALGAAAFAQDIPHTLTPEITTAYTDTDGDGVRADQRPPSAVSHYAEIDRLLTEQLPRPRNETVVLTADISFLSYYPYYGFQALTSHYANPLGDFDGRAAAIARWSELQTADELIAALDASPWRGPDAILFRQSEDGFTLRLAEDVYPNDPNVRRYTVTFPKELFDDPRFEVTEIGPFVLVVRR